MPYIEKPQRLKYDRGLEPIINDLKSSKNLEGHLNYIITTLIDQVGPNKKNYAHYNAMIGVLESAKQEYYRRVISPYEDHKRFENGDVYK
jgi:hypothetical protein